MGEPQAHDDVDGADERVHLPPFQVARDRDLPGEPQPCDLGGEPPGCVVLPGEEQMAAPAGGPEAGESIE